MCLPHTRKKYISLSSFDIHETTKQNLNQLQTLEALS
jgi:hypothetical protein